MNNIGLWGTLFGIGILLLVGKYVILRRMRQAKKQEVTTPAPLPMPGFPAQEVRTQSITVKVTKYLLDEENMPEWVKELFADPDYPGPLPTHAELQESLFAEIERLGIKIPE